MKKANINSVKSQTPYEAMVREAGHIVKFYRDDLYVHDAKAI